MSGHKTHTGLGTVVLDDDGVIRCDLTGYITGNVVKGTTSQTKAFVAELHADGRPAYLLIDISGVTGHDSEARSIAKEIGTYGLNKIAVAGGNRMLTMVGQYIVRAGNMGRYTRFLRTVPAAKRWLFDTSSLEQKSFAVPYVLSCCLAVLLASGALLGWMLDMDALKAVVPALKPMNPMTAVTLLMATGAILLIRTDMTVRRRWTITALAASVGIFGALGFARHVSAWDIPIDRLLFASQLTGSVQGGRSALASAICFMLVAAMIILVAHGMRRPWQYRVFYISSGMLFTVVLVTFIRHAFGLDRFYSFSAFFPMALNTAVAFLALSHALQALHMPSPGFSRLRAGVAVYTQAAIVGAAVLLITGVAWQQSRIELERTATERVDKAFIEHRDAVVARMEVYIGALKGFKALFQSSAAVDADEYKRYFESSHLAKDHPGFTAINFVRYEVRGGSPAYILTYAEPATVKANLGVDLATDPIRRAAMERARDTGQAAATSGIINLSKSLSSSGSQRPGFSIVVPVYNLASSQQEPTTVAARQAALRGFVHSVFESDVVFGDVFASAPTGVRYTLAYAESGESIYDHTSVAGTNATPSHEEVIAIAGQNMKLGMYASPTFGTSTLDRRTPALILAGGTLLALLATALMLAQARRREQAFSLAEHMTEDLNKERNAAVALQQKDEAILSSIGDAVFAIDIEERITLFNPAAERISGYSAAEAIGKPYKEVLHFTFETGKINDSFIHRALSGHMASMRSPTQLVHKDGRLVQVADSAAPIRNGNRAVLGAIIVFRDVSKEFLLDKAKSEFVSLASHQLRTPLSAVNWFSEMLLNNEAGKMSAEQRNYLSQIYDSNKRMIELVNSLLDVSRLELGKLANAPEAVDMPALAEDLKHELQSAINDKHLNILMKIPKNLPRLSADVKLMRMVVQNLFSNAVKYTPNKGTVTLTMRTASQADLEKARLHSTHDHFMFMVSDTGYGIPKTQQGQIFEKLFRADNVQKIGVEGTGLGLYIVKEIAEKLGGRVWFESAEGVGTTFYFVVPYRTKAVAARAKMES